MSPLEPAEVPAALRGLRVAVLVSGGVAAYKVADLVSRLAQEGCQVRVGMTAAATRFVGAATFRALSGRPVELDLWSGAHPEPHVELGDWAQLILLAPATADVLARVAHGQADDLVTATLLAARCPVVVAPAMNDAMWEKPAVQDNLDLLRTRGCSMVEPEAGHLASGHTGSGRLAGPQTILDAMAGAVRPRLDLAGRRVVVSAGGTREPIDPVRFVGNYSSGKMGFALAAAAADRGARVVLVSAAAHSPHHGVEVQHVDTAEEMLAELRTQLKGADLLLMAAAVGDFRPARATGRKIRREETPSLNLQLVPIPDLVAELAGDEALAGVFRVGFAAEDSDLDAKGAEKLKRKGLHAIVANDISRRDIGFGSDYNAGVLLFADGSRHELAKATKREMADRILDLVLPKLTSLSPSGRGLG